MQITDYGLCSQGLVMRLHNHLASGPRHEIGYLIRSSTAPSRLPKRWDRVGAIALRCGRLPKIRCDGIDRSYAPGHRGRSEERRVGKECRAGRARDQWKE